MSLRKGESSLRMRRALSVCRRRLTLQERLLRESEQKLADQYRAMASVAHDLRSPLQTVNVALALISADAPASMEKPLRLAKASLARASGLLYDLLDFSALAHGQGIPLKKHKLRLSELVVRVLDDTRLRFPDRALDAQDRAPEVWVDADVNRLTQVLDNLISNALLHGAPKTCVKVCVEAYEQEVAVRVQNAGAISEAARAVLFQPLSHGESALRRGSMGLGLYIVKQLVDAHAGRVELSVDAESTTFSVLLPRLRED